MVPAEPGEAEEEAGECGAGPGALPLHGAGKEQDDDGGEDGAGGDVEPGDGAEEAAAGEAERGEDGGGIAAVPVAAEGVAGECGEGVERDPVGVEQAELEIAVAEREKEKQQIQREERAGLGLPDERLARPEGRVPEREPALMQFAGEELQAWDFDVDHVGMVEPDEFACEDELPEEYEHQQD